MKDLLRRRARLLRHLVTRPYPVDGTTPAQRRGMKMLWWDSLLSSTSASFYGDFAVLYLLALGASSGIIGTRASINSAAALLAPLLGAWLVGRTGKRKRWVLWGGGGVGRLALMLTVFVPLFMGGDAAIIAVVGLVALQSFAGSVSLPAAHSLFGDVVPLPIRGRYLGVQMMAANIARVAVVPVAGWLITRVGGVEGYQLTIGLAVVVGFWATSFYARVPEPRGAEGVAEEHKGSGFAEGLRLFVADRWFLLFCLINWVWTFGIQISGPFFSLHMVETLGFGIDTISLIATVTTVVNIVAVRFAGSLVDRKGPGWITASSMLLVPLMPVGWIFATTPFQVGLVVAYGNLAWAGFRVAATPLLLKITPPAHRSQFIAMFNMVNSIAAILGPIPASWVYAQWGFTANLTLSAIGRGLGAVLFSIMLLKGGFRTKSEELESKPI